MQVTAKAWDRIWCWLLFLAYVPVPAVEAEAIVTYANNYLPYFIRPGIACAALLGVTSLLNLMVVRWLLNVNSTITWWKILVPVLTIIGLMTAGTHWSVTSAAPHSYPLSGMLTALPAAGIVFSYLGFRTAIDLGGETANPHRNIPLAVIGAVLLTAALYIMLQVAFLWALSPAGGSEVLAICVARPLGRRCVCRGARFSGACPLASKRGTLPDTPRFSSSKRAGPTASICCQSRIACVRKSIKTSRQYQPIPWIDPNREIGRTITAVAILRRALVSNPSSAGIRRTSRTRFCCSAR